MISNIDNLNQTRMGVDLTTSITILPNIYWKKTWNFAIVFKVRY